MSSAPALRLELRASASLTLLTIGAHACAASIALTFLPLSAGVCAAALLAALGTLAATERTLLCSGRSPAALRLEGDGNLGVRLRDGREAHTRLGARRYVSRWLVVFELQAPIAGRRRIVLARDMLSPEGFRRLRLWALWDALPAPGSGPMMPDAKN